MPSTKDIVIASLAFLAVFGLLVYVIEYSSIGCTPENIDWCGPAR